MNFSEIYNQHKSLVFNLALQYVQNIEDAEEITQDVFVIVYNKLETFRRDSDIKTWIYRITINKSLDFIKSKAGKKKWALFSYLDDGLSGKHTTSNFNHPGIEMEQKQELERIFKCINQLPDNQKTTIILLKIELKTQAEVATIMNISTKAVESLFQRAKKNLEKLLSQTEGK